MLPIVGLFLFSLVSWRDFRVNREMHQHFPNKYFMWAGIPLDTAPTKRRTWDVGRCKESDEHCVAWDLRDPWVDPGLLDRFLLLTALPAFVLGGLIVKSLRTTGINELTSFMFLMPVLLLVWFYFVGRVIDGWIQRMRKRKMTGPD